MNLSDRRFICRCEREIIPEVIDGVIRLECKDCGIATETRAGVKGLTSNWLKKFGTAARIVRQRKTEKNQSISIKPGTINHFIDKVSSQTRARMIRENFSKGVDDAKLDAASKIEVSKTENGKHTIIRIGPRKTFLVSDDGEIMSVNRKERYGTLKTIDQWDWSGYWPVFKDEIWRNGGRSMKTPAIKGKREIFK